MLIHVCHIDFSLVTGEPYHEGTMVCAIKSLSFISLKITVFHDSLFTDRSVSQIFGTTCFWWGYHQGRVVGNTMKMGYMVSYRISTAAYGQFAKKTSFGGEIRECSRGHSVYDMFHRRNTGTACHVHQAAIQYSDLEWLYGSQTYTNIKTGVTLQ